MTRFNIGGLWLDTPADLSLSFVKKNVIFAFDDVECERSTDFAVPATENNNYIFGVARDEHSAGLKMRTGMTAQMQTDGMTRNGTLYITAFDCAKNEYKCLFVTGELQGLAAIKNAGSVRNLVPYSEEISTWGGQPMIAAHIGNNDYYQNEGQGCVPNIQIKYIIDSAFAALGLTPPAIDSTLRMVIGAPKTPTGALVARFTKIGDYQTSYSTSQMLNTATSGDGNKIPWGIFGTYSRKIRFWDNNISTPYLYANIQQLVTSNELQLTFAEDFSDDIFIVSFPENAAQLPQNDPDVYKQGGTSRRFTIGVFLGGYSLQVDELQGTSWAVGTPLAGRTITIERNTPFVFLNKSAMRTNDVEQGQEFKGAGWRDFGGTYYDTQARVEEADAVEGDWIAINNNLPDITLTDFLKTIAAIQNTVLYYDEENGLQLINPTPKTWRQRAIDKVIERGLMTRTFGNFGQRNYVKFAGDSTQIQEDKVSLDYTVHNDTLAAENTLLEMPFSEGSKYGRYLYLRNSEQQKAPQTPIICRLFSDYGSLFRFEYDSNGQMIWHKVSGVSGLCETSTSMTIKAVMTLLDFTQITPMTLLYIYGARYVWTEMQWSAGIVTMQTSKIQE